MLVRNKRVCPIHVLELSSLSITLGHRRTRQKDFKYIYCHECFFNSIDSSQSPGEFEKEREMLSSLTVKEANHNPLLNNAMNNQGTCQF